MVRIAGCREVAIAQHHRPGCGRVSAHLRPVAGEVVGVLDVDDRVAVDVGVRAALRVGGALLDDREVEAGPVAEGARVLGGVLLAGSEAGSVRDLDVGRRERQIARDVENALRARERVEVVELDGVEAGVGAAADPFADEADDPIALVGARRVEQHLVGPVGVDERFAVDGDEQVKSVFVNVFGGITSCVAVAEGIVKALEILGDAATKPLVVRLDGNQVEEGRAILAEANHPLVTLASGMDEGADKAAELANA